jgi:aspartokinase
MTNIVHTVWRIIDDDPSIKRELSRGLLNTSALARYIIKEKKINTTLDAVISAIRRYQVDKYTDIFSPATKLLGQTINISTRSNLAEIALLKDADVQRILPRVFDVISYVRGDVLRIMQANESVRLLIDEKNMERVFRLFPKNKIIAKEKNLAEITIYIHPQMQKTPGVLSVLANELALHGINIVEVMTCPPEMLFIVKKEDFQRASDVIYQLCQPMKP